MKITTKEWVLFLLLGILGVMLWCNYDYQRFSYMDLHIDKSRAINQAGEYLLNRGIDPKEYKRAIIFRYEQWPDCFLQKSLGPGSQADFMSRHGFELFSWQVRYFKESQKEEYNVGISPETGEIVNFTHLIDDVAPRDQIDAQFAKARAAKFLEETYGLNLKGYDFHEEKQKRYEQRIDYSFSWQKKGVYIPWQKSEGGGLLLTGVTVSGDEIRAFYKQSLDIPEAFQRYIRNQMAAAEYVYSFYIISLLIFIAGSVLIVLRKGNSFVMRLSRRWYVILAVFLVVLNTLYIFNGLQSVLYGYPTSSRMFPFLGSYLIKAFILLVFGSFSFILPGLAGESLARQDTSLNTPGGFFQYLKTTFFSRAVTRGVMLGYVFCCILLGFQALLFHIGQKYFGVWKEWIRLTNLSGDYLPFLGAFIIGVQASLVEETLFRLFGISWLRKYLKNIVLAIVVSSLIWGFGHSGYAIFPTWFKGAEVSLLGILFGIVFIRYGLIPVLVAHYLFDVFWGVSAYLFGKSPVYIFWGSFSLLCLPLVLALAAYLSNRSETETKVKEELTAVDKYNLGVLKAYVVKMKEQGATAEGLKGQLISNEWDAVLVEAVIKEVF